MTDRRQRHVNQALMRIPRRAESTDRSTLATTYVAAGSFSAMLNSEDHQILYGRRGTGKTHALLYLSDVVERAGDVAVYVDLRTIGSAGGLYADSSLSPSTRGTHLLVDTLEAIHEELLTAAMEREFGDPDGLLRAMDTLVDASTAVEVVGEVEAETRLGEKEHSGAGVELSVSTAPRGRISAGQQRTVRAESRLRRTGVEQHRVLFGPLGRALRAVAKAMRPSRLWVLLDEWSSLPVDLQPLLADLLRRSVLPVPGITVKIAAIERRSRFFVPNGNDYLGIEVGSDAASAVSLDDFMIFDHTQNRAQEFFGQLFYNHAGPRLATMMREPPADADAFLGEAFRRGAFAELVRAAEGVPRDAINIAALAAQHANAEPIALADVRNAAKDWYLRDKRNALAVNEPARRTLQLLVDEIVGNRRSRTFVLDQLGYAAYETIDELYDARLLHLLRRGIVDPQHPGRLYDGFAIDYGCYVSLLLVGDQHTRVRDRGGWISSPKGVPPDGFSLSRVAVDLPTLLKGMA
ncbi:hypothetical protein [Kutzneria sp. CA-103260]|uniref:hypothetical protein n=1 Tax=Kutzneria sp. CA-103260 TaxID=2802641 RepID=UPI001BA826AC|nr:hypothetical protein [Kutzneria sp. CA-103260]QUQ62802.1 hypothetical protein JJ691_05140 [Kutzneria sp. CA-103260]